MRSTRDAPQTISSWQFVPLRFERRYIELIKFTSCPSRCSQPKKSASTPGHVYPRVLGQIGKPNRVEEPDTAWLTILKRSRRKTSDRKNAIESVSGDGSGSFLAEQIRNVLLRRSREASRMRARREKVRRRTRVIATFFQRSALLAKDYRFACAAVGARERRYDDINLTCTRVHCYDNVFKCQPHERPAAERARYGCTRPLPRHTERRQRCDQTRRRWRQRRQSRLHDRRIARLRHFRALGSQQMMLTDAEERVVRRHDVSSRRTGVWNFQATGAV